jgi:hydroxypyruvate isomerase
MMFTELPFLQRFAAAAAAGFEAVEFLFPYDFPKEEVKLQLVSNNLKLVLFNLPAGDFAAGDRGLACNPARVAEFRASVAIAVEYAEFLGCRQLHCMAGLRPAAGPDVADHESRLRETYQENLRFAAQALNERGITMVIEAINTRDIPGFYLSKPSEALRLIRELELPNLKLLYDIYHAQIMEGDLSATIAKNLDQISHVQIADTPGRHEPGTGEINYPFLFQHLDELGFAGFLGCEYKPKTTAKDGLAWFEPYRPNKQGASK